MDGSRELALQLDDGTVIYDSGWLCVADVMHSFHGFGVRQVYGVIVHQDTGEVHPHCLPPQQVDPPASP